MILGFKDMYPDNEPTYFLEKILMPYTDVQLPPGIYSPKIHSIRKGNRWRAGMSIQMAYGVRTNHYTQFNKDYPQLGKCISEQDIFMTYDRHALEITVGNINYLMPQMIDKLILNDGLTRERFLDWFFPGTVDEFSGQIVHWTDYKY